MMRPRKNRSSVAAATIVLSAIQNLGQLIEAIEGSADGDTIRCATEALAGLGEQAAPRMGKTLHSKQGETP